MKTFHEASRIGLYLELEYPDSIVTVNYRAVTNEYYVVMQYHGMWLELFEPSQIETLVKKYVQIHETNES